MNSTSPTSGIRQGVLTFCRSLEAPSGQTGHYSYAGGLHSTLWASALVALTRNLLNDIAPMHSDDRDDWLAYLLRCQDERTGLFVDPCYHAQQREKGACPEPMFLWRTSSAINAAIMVLGGQPKFPIDAIRPLMEEGEVRSWLEGLPWKDQPHIAASWVFHFACLGGTNLRCGYSTRILPLLPHVFRWLENAQDPVTGFWGGTSGIAPQYTLVATHSISEVFWLYGRETPRSEKMLAQVLELQQREGHFGGSHHADFSGVDLAVTLAQHTNKGGDAMRSAMERALTWLLACQSRSGGFVSDPKGKEHQRLGWSMCRAETGQADAWSTLLRTMAVARVNDISPGALSEKITWKAHGAFFHGIRKAQIATSVRVRKVEGGERKRAQISAIPR